MKASAQRGSIKGDRGPRLTDFSSTPVEKLKVVHVPYTFAPDSVGGTEIYVETLARGLKAHGIQSLVVAPSASGDDQAYEHDGLRLRRLRSPPDADELLRG